jgi:hypothetical protein
VRLERWAGGIKMFEKARESQRHLEMFFAPSAPEEFVKMVKSFHDGPGAER